MKPDAAFEGLLKAREELVEGARTYLPKRDYAGLRDYLSPDDEDGPARHMNNFELYASALLSSNRLDAESKKSIGTIRTYGVGADVSMMYGGLQAALQDDPPRTGDVDRYIANTLDSLTEVISICRGNGFGA